MMTIFGAIALTLTLPVGAQADPASPAACHAAQGEQLGKRSMDDMHKSCRKMMKHHARLGRRAKTEAERLDADVNGNGHQGHNH